MSQSSNHLRLVSWTWQWVHFTQMSSTVSRFQSNREHLWKVVEREIHIMDVQPKKSAATAWCYHVNMDQILWGMFPTPSEVLKAKGGQSEVYLIKWPVSLYVHPYIHIPKKCIRYYTSKYLDNLYSHSGDMFTNRTQDYSYKMLCIYFPIIKRKKWECTKRGIVQQKQWRDDYATLGLAPREILCTRRCYSRKHRFYSTKGASKRRDLPK